MDRSFFDTARVAHLATVDSRGHPSIVPICFVITERALYTALDAKPKKKPARELARVRNILANPNVAVLVDHYEEDWSRLKWVMLRGLASLLSSGEEEHQAAIEALRRKYPQYREMDLDSTLVIRVALQRFSSWPEVS